MNKMGIDCWVRELQKLPCDAQYAIARRVAANVGYDLRPDGFVGLPSARRRKIAGTLAVGIILGCGIAVLIMSHVFSRELRIAKEWHGIAADWRTASNRFEEVAKKAQAGWNSCLATIESH